MNKTAEQAAEEKFPSYEYDKSIEQTDEFSGNEIRSLQRLAFMDGAAWQASQSQWIDVNDKDNLPAKGERVQVYDENYGVQIGWLTKSDRWELAYQMSSVGNVTHWQPLPKPPIE